MSNIDGASAMGETIRGAVLAATPASSLPEACETIRRAGVTVSFSGTITSQDTRERDIDGVYLAPDDTAPWLDALLRGDMAGASDEFCAALLYAYGIGAGWVETIDALTLTPGRDS